MSELLKNIIRFILLILLQVFVLNKIMLHGYVTPYIYLLFVLLLPFTIPRWALMVCAVLLGLCLDLFMNTAGMHALACLTVAYFRPFVINILAPHDGFETQKVTPSIVSMGWAPFMTYATILVIIHHLVYFILEVFSFQNVLFLLFRILLSALVSLVLVLIFEMLFAPLGRRTART